MPRSKAFQFTIATLLMMFVAATSIAQEATVESLVKGLSSKQASVQIAAANRLAAMGKSAAPATSVLAKALTSPTVEVRNAAALAIAAIGSDANGAAGALVSALQDKDAGVRARAAYALGKIGNASDATLQAMINSSLDPDVTVRRHIRDALRNIKPPREKTLPIWVRTLKEADTEEVMPALMTLAEEGKGAIPVLTDALKHDDACYWATLIVAEIGPDAAPLTPNLVDVLKRMEDDPEIRMNALVALGEIGTGAAGARDDIIEHLQSEKSDNVRYAAAYALTAIEDEDSATEPAKAALAKLLIEKDLGLRSIAARGLLLNDPDGLNEEKARKVTVEALASDDPDIRHLAVRTLAEMTPRGDTPSEEIIDAFVNAMNDSSPHVIGEVIGALAAQGKNATPRVIRGLANKELRPYAVQIAILLGPDAEPAVPGLIEAWDKTTDDDDLKREIQFALGSIGSASAPAIPKLIESLRSKTPDLRYSACYALGQIGPTATAAALGLKQMLSSSDEFDKLAGVWALIRIMPNDSDVRSLAIPILTEALKDPQEHIRIKAAATLGHIGSAAKAAIPALRAATQDPDPNVADAAKTAIEDIQGN